MNSPPWKKKHSDRLPFIHHPFMSCCAVSGVSMGLLTSPWAHPWQRPSAWDRSGAALIRNMFHCYVKFMQDTWKVDTPSGKSALWSYLIIERMFCCPLPGRKHMRPNRAASNRVASRGGEGWKGKNGHKKCQLFSSHWWHTQKHLGIPQNREKSAFSSHA